VISIILVAGLLLIAMYGIRLIIERSRFVGFGLLLLSVIGIPLVIFPDAATSVANSVGVGRGADLLIYVLFILVLLSLLVIHALIRDLNQRLTRVVRAVALVSAHPPLPPMKHEDE
jgi:hypothetical protein